MKLSYAALLSGITALTATLFTILLMRSGLRVQAVLLPRQEWLLDNMGVWAIGWWLWLIVIFGWMVLLVTLMWSYTPAHRVSTMLQSGLMIISAVLLIIGVAVWMNLLPLAINDLNPESMTGLVDMLALSLVNSGLFMGGLVTAWITLDLALLKKLPWLWLAPGIAAGILAAPSPFLVPQWPELLALSGVCWLVWCVLLITRQEAPARYDEYDSSLFT
ncbi:MAG: hypothetical protein AAF639_30330 [Chloroflexota bacterium]